MDSYRGRSSRDILSAHSLRRECVAKQLRRKILQPISSFSRTQKGCGKQNSTGSPVRACAICDLIERRLRRALRRVRLQGTFDFRNAGVDGADGELGLLFVNQERRAEAQSGVARA